MGCSPGLLLPRLNGVAVLARDDLDLGRRYYLVRLHLERRLFDDESPYVITQAVCVQMALKVMDELI